MSKDVILTGIRANEEPHLGNYLGAMLPMVELQRKFAGEYELNMFVPDLHSFTTPVDYGSLQQNIIRNLKYFTAAGLDFQNTDTFIYRQSYIPAHSELTWILDCFTGFGEMSRMTQFKEKQQNLSTYANNLTPENNYQGDFPPVTVGLFNYPVLMAADILLYNAKWIPVGDDQTQHLEIARDIALRINHKFADVFPEGVFTLPEETKKQLEFAKRDNGVRIRSLANPEKKMSKSVHDTRGTILLSDEPTIAAKKVIGATTDSVGAINFDWKKQPGVTNLLQMLALLSGRSQDEINGEWVGKQNYGELKKTVATQVENFLSSFHAKLEEIDLDALTAKMESDEAAMRKIADKTLLRAQQAVGLRPRP